MKTRLENPMCGNTYWYITLTYVFRSDKVSIFAKYEILYLQSCIYNIGQKVDK